MDKNHDKRQQLIFDLLRPGRDAAGGIDPVRPWKRLAAHLNPLIGETGFTALYGRAIRLMQSHYPWLAGEQSMRSTDSLFTNLASQLSSVNATLAAEANLALLDTFSKLLSGLIGEALTIRLLNSAWDDASHQGNAKEQK